MILGAGARLLVYDGKKSNFLSGTKYTYLYEYIRYVFQICKNVKDDT